MTPSKVDVSREAALLGFGGAVVPSVNAVQKDLTDWENVIS
tara:strand:- start:410 stop:532 length:123 start_codon:yes stop_codon:yes gene_type:complete